jgi:uncharacterized protein YecE (DUF72 family)
MSVSCYFPAVEGNTTLVGIPLALEFRHPNWFEPVHADKFQELLMDLQIDRVILDARQQDPDYPFKSLMCLCGRI